MKFRDRLKTSLSWRVPGVTRDRTLDHLAPDSGKRSPRILLVDDAPVNLAVCCRMLGRMGCIVEPASTGEYAVAMFREGCAETRYDLVLMDLNMPGMNGVDTTRAIRRIEAGLEAGHPYRTRPVPILALTAYNPGDKLKEYIAAGMNDFMYKPFQAEVVRDALLRWVSAPA